MNDHVAGKAADLLLERQFAALRPELLRLPLWLARDRSIAEDAVQETLLRAWKARGSLDDPSWGPRRTRASASCARRSCGCRTTTARRS